MRKLGLSSLIGLVLIGLAGCKSTAPTKVTPTGEEKKCGDTTNPCPPTPKNPPAKEQILDKLKSATLKIEVTKSNLRGGGTGFLIDDKHVVTNNHVASGASMIKVNIEDENREIIATPVAYAECADLAILELQEDTNIDHLQWYEHDIKSGDEMAVAGYPGNERDGNRNRMYVYKNGTVSTTVSELHFPWSSVKAFSHSAKISGGNSGGPAIEMKTGKVIGINFAGNSDNDQNYAISGKMAQDYVNRMIKGENIHSIGIYPKTDVFLNTSLGVKVQEVTAGGKASDIGIIKKDLIVELGNSSLQGTNSNVYTLEKYCNILKTFNPNHPKNPNDNDIGGIVPIKIVRWAKDQQYRYRSECEGEINGKSLTLSTMEKYDKDFNPLEKKDFLKDTTPCPKS